MLYHIVGLCPRTDIPMGRCGFSIQLFPAWREAVAQSGLAQALIDTGIKNMHRRWLDGCGYDAIYDPDADPRAQWEEKHLGKKAKLGPNAHPLYDVHAILVTWGEWGPEHITVPGNACGLDLDQGLGAPLDGRVLDPHNIDSMAQQILLLSVFTFFADQLIDQLEVADSEAKRRPITFDNQR